MPYRVRLLIRFRSVYVQFNTAKYFETQIVHAGELPLTIGMLKANGCDVDLRGNKGFTLSSDISAVSTATKLDFSNCYLQGERAKSYARNLSRVLQNTRARN